MPRVSEVLARSGKARGVADDLKLGWNFDRPQDRASCLAETRAMDPDLTIGCPPRGSMSALMEWNYSR
eukprot:5885230-Pyramimonas_sp.AAC.1